jgi:hypothetical protein
MSDHRAGTSSAGLPVIAGASVWRMNGAHAASA